VNGEIVVLPRQPVQGDTGELFQEIGAFTPGIVRLITGVLAIDPP
jgi:hypothetical protein